MALNEAQKQERSEYLEKNLTITECSQRRPYVFISYASSDWETVFKSAVVPLQRQCGLRVYADKAFDKTNDRWIVPMLRNIRGSDMMVAFVSQSYIESYACFLELLTAVNNKKQIVFVSLEQKLDLGDTTDQPLVERGVKAEILNQGANIATNVNNTSNDLMRAMKSAYTSISTLLEQDALSKYDISDAFINFFRDAAINLKTINDLNAVRRTIGSISENVFDGSLITEQAPAAETAPAAAARQPVPIQTPASGSAPAAIPAQGPAPQPAAWQQPVSGPYGQNAFQPGRPGQPGPGAQAAAAPGKKQPNKKVLTGAAGAAVLLIVIAIVLVLLFGGGTKNVTDREYTTPDGFSGLYTGGWKGDGPSGRGTMTLDSGDIFEGEWADGVLNGQGTGTWTNGNTYEGEFKDNKREGQGVFTFANGDVYEGEFRDNKREGQGVFAFANGDVYEGEFKDGKREGTGTMTYAGGAVYKGEWKDEKKDGTGIQTDADGTVWDGEWSGDSFVRGHKTLPDGKYMEGSWDVGTGRFSSGIMSAANGNTFEGTWDVNTGFFINGTITYGNGDVYEGHCEDDRRNGQGKATYANGDVREGTWKDGGLATGIYDRASDGAHFDGEWDLETGNLLRGTMIETDGTVYEGEWDPETRHLVNGRRTTSNGDYRDGAWDPETGDFISGTARATQNDGRVYEGEWSNGTANGRGTITFTDGTSKTGLWQDGTMVEED